MTGPGMTSKQKVTLEGSALVFTNYTIDTAAVVAEASRWTSGARGEADRQAAEGADLAPFASTALTLGAQMLAYGADAGGVASLSGTVSQLADRAQQASTALAGDVARASKVASDSAVTATREAARITNEALGTATQRAVQEISCAVTATRETLQAELARLLGGEDTPVTKAVQQLVAKQMADSAVTMQRTFAETLGSVSATLDVGNPGSPLSKLEARIGERQERQHGEVTRQLEKVQEAVATATAAAQTAGAVAAARDSSTAKGRPFEESVGLQMEEIAAGLGGTYTSVGDTTGALRACKKGDGILELPAVGGAAGVRVVVEMTTTGASRKWSPYLEEAERNRGAQASLGVVPSSLLVPGGALLAPVGAARLVVAAGEGNDAGLLRAACVLLALRAQREAAAQQGGEDMAVVDERLAEAERLLDTLTEVLKSAAGVKAGAAKVMAGIEGVQEALGRALAQARAALALAGGDTGRLRPVGSQVI